MTAAREPEGMVKPYSEAELAEMRQFRGQPSLIFYGPGFCYDKGEARDRWLATLDALKAASLSPASEPPSPTVHRFNCSECGITKVDEDGCCATCGRDAEPVTIPTKDDPFAPSRAPGDDGERFTKAAMEWCRLHSMCERMTVGSPRYEGVSLSRTLARGRMMELYAYLASRGGDGKRTTCPQCHSDRIRYGTAYPHGVSCFAPWHDDEPKCKSCGSHAAKVPLCASSDHATIHAVTANPAFEFVKGTPCQRCSDPFHDASRGAGGAEC